MAKVMISVPDDLLARIDREVARSGETRSGFLQDAARRKLGPLDLEAFDRALARARAAAAGGLPGDSTAFIRADRDERDDRHRRPE